MRRRTVRSITVLVVAVSTLMLATPAGGGTTPARQPDAQVRRPAAGDAWIGKNIFATVGQLFETEQELEVDLIGRYKFEFRVRNAGRVSDRYDITAHLWRSFEPCTFKIKRNGRDITTRITTQGVTTNTLAPGAKTDVFDLIITAGTGAANCSIEMRVRSAVSFARQDGIIATVANTA